MNTHQVSSSWMKLTSLGAQEESDNSGGDLEAQRTMLELLNQLDGFGPTKTIKVIMATNRIGSSSENTYS